jgi:hypothetical protein
LEQQIAGAKAISDFRNGKFSAKKAHFEYWSCKMKVQKRFSTFHSDPKGFENLSGLFS